MRNTCNAFFRGIDELWNISEVWQAETCSRPSGAPSFVPAGQGEVVQILGNAWYSYHVLCITDRSHRYVHVSVSPQQMSPTTRGEREETQSVSDTKAS